MEVVSCLEKEHLALMDECELSIPAKPLRLPEAPKPLQDHKSLLFSWAFVDIPEYDHEYHILNLAMTNLRCSF